MAKARRGAANVVAAGVSCGMMDSRRWIVAILMLGVPGVRLVGQARPDCPARPATLDQMRGCYRPLLVFAARGDDPRLAAQRDALDQDADDMMDRFVLLVPVVEKGKGLRLPLDAPYVVLSSSESVAVRKRFGVAPGSFKVVLLGEDGGAKLRSGAPVPVERLNGLIDSMPTRRVEMQRPHAN